MVIVLYTVSKNDSFRCTLFKPSSFVTIIIICKTNMLLLLLLLIEHDYYTSNCYIML